MSGYRQNINAGEALKVERPLRTGEAVGSIPIFGSDESPSRIVTVRANSRHGGSVSHRLSSFYHTDLGVVLPRRTSVPHIKSRELRRLIERALEAGWRVRHHGGHVTVYPSDKSCNPIVISGSPSDGHAVKNCRSQLRQAGLDL